MKGYRYSALDATGAVKTGSIDAEDLHTAATVLRRQGLVPFSVDADTKPTSLTSWLKLERTTKTTLKWRLSLIRQVAALTSAGISLDRALHLMSSQAKDRFAKSIFDKVLQQVSAGVPLSQSLAKARTGLRDDEIGLIAAGEQSGDLPRALEDLTTILEKRLKTQAEFASALLYPAFLLILAPVSLLIIAFVLVPNIAPLFEGNDAAMPLTLRAMIFVTSALKEHTAFAALSAALVAGLAVLLVQRIGWRPILAHTTRRLPIIQDIARKTDMSRLCSVLASLLRGGSSLQSALGLCAAAARTEAVRAEVLSARNQVQSGVKLTKALEAVSVIDGAARQMIAIGEETNRLDAMLDYVAVNAERDAERRTAQLMTLLTPLLTIVMGLLVGGIVMSIMQAILKVNELAVQ